MAPKEIPAELRNEYTMNNRLRVKPWYFDEKYLGGNAYLPLWKQTQIDQWVSLARQGRLKGNYGIQETASPYRPNPECSIELKVTIASKLPKVLFRKLIRKSNGTIVLTFGCCDIICPYSNVTTSRAPASKTHASTQGVWEGDIIAIARAWCVTKPGGSLTLGVPYVNSGVDYIAFNAGRFYGKIRYPYLATNWRQIYRGKGGIHRVHVFSKMK
jgi:hypothetical protein